ncbi:MAG TPA: GNAT family N-acetyltransferase [Candidatus Limnocylindrales bacterium]|nr:GNAT family N-acetyltransferase [Candidatus Limnocylindrales bacterium]
MSSSDAAGERDGGDFRFRRPVEADHPMVVALVDEWWGGRKLHDLLPRLWFQHFCGTSWIVEAAGRPIGFLVGFISPDEPTLAYIHMVATDPNRRRRGLGRGLYERFFGDVAARGATRVRAITWPGNRTSVAFHRALGFRPTEGPGTMNLYGTPSFPNYDYPGEDRVLFERRLSPP